MFSVRKVKTRSGSTAVQVVRYIGHRSIILKHIGSAKDDTELSVFLTSDAFWIHSGSAFQTVEYEQYKNPIFGFYRTNAYLQT